MGRPKKGAKSPPPSSGRIGVILLKGTPEYAAWFDALHKKTHIPKATMMRLAIADWAVKNGHQPPPEI